MVIAAASVTAGNLAEQTKEERRRARQSDEGRQRKVKLAKSG